MSSITFTPTTIPNATGSSSQSFEQAFNNHLATTAISLGIQMKGAAMKLYNKRQSEAKEEERNQQF